MKRYLKKSLAILDDLVEFISEYCLLGFPFTPSEIRQIAFEFVDENKIQGFSEDKEMAGTKWFSLFLKCHSELKVKHGATNLSLARAMGSTNTIIENWFDQYEDLVAQLGIDDPAYIWNIDEHGSEHLHKVKRVVGITVSSAATQKSTAHYNANLCQCCWLCSPTNGNSLREIP